MSPSNLIDRYNDLCAARRKRESVGRPERVSFQYANGDVGERVLYPILNEFGSVIRWADEAGARASLAARGIL